MLAKEAVSARLNSEAGHQLHRVQLPDPAGQRLPRAAPAARGDAADRRLRPVGQPHRRHRPGPPHRGCRACTPSPRPLVTKSDGTKFGKSEGGAVWLDPALTSPVRLLPVLAQRRRRRRPDLAAAVLRAPGRGGRGADRGEHRAPGRPDRAAGAGRGAHRAGPRARASWRRPRPPAGRCSAGTTWPRSGRRPSAPRSSEAGSVTRGRRGALGAPSCSSSPAWWAASRRPAGR